jgi:hypothetical protein
MAIATNFNQYAGEYVQGDALAKAISTTLREESGPVGGALRELVSLPPQNTIMNILDIMVDKIRFSANPHAGEWLLSKEPSSSLRDFTIEAKAFCEIAARILPEKDLNTVTKAVAKLTR